MNNFLTRYRRWLNHGIFAFIGTFLHQSHHYLDHLDIFLPGSSHSNVQSLFTDYMLNVAKNPKYFAFASSHYPLLLGPIYLPLSIMKPILGPKNRRIYEPFMLFELSVLQKKKEILRGWNPPPVFITFRMIQKRWQLVIGDGTHRHEALVRNGYHGYYAIICYHPSDTEDLKGYLNSKGIKYNYP